VRSILILAILSIHANAALSADVGSKPQKAAFRPPEATTSNLTTIRQPDVIVFSAPPRGTEAEERAVFDPIAKYLSSSIGKEVIYRYPGNWGVYRGAMVRDEYDIVFDGPHFNSYRSEKHQHRIIVKAPGSIEIAVFVKNSRYRQLQELAGRSICSHAPPNLGALAVLKQFTNPSRQPIITNSSGWADIFAGVMSGKCQAGVAPFATIEKNANKDKIRIIYKEKAFPNQAFSVSNRVNLQLQEKIAAALIADEASAPTEKLRQSYALGRMFVVTNNSEYAGISVLLKDEWGYY